MISWIVWWHTSAPTSNLNYVNMQDNYVDMHLISFFMRDDYVIIQIIISCMSTKSCSMLTYYMLTYVSCMLTVCHCKIVVPSVQIFSCWHKDICIVLFIVDLISYFIKCWWNQEYYHFKDRLLHAVFARLLCLLYFLESICIYLNVHESNVMMPTPNLLCCTSLYRNQISHLHIPFISLEKKMFYALAMNTHTHFWLLCRFQNELPVAIQEREEKHITKPELCKLMKWKLSVRWYMYSISPGKTNWEGVKCECLSLFKILDLKHDL